MTNRTIEHLQLCENVKIRGRGLLSDWHNVRITMTEVVCDGSDNTLNSQEHIPGRRVISLRHHVKMVPHSKSARRFYPCSVKLLNMWHYNSMPPHIIMVHRGNSAGEPDKPALGQCDERLIRRCIDVYVLVIERCFLVFIDNLASIVRAIMNDD